MSTPSTTAEPSPTLAGGGERASGRPHVRYLRYVLRHKWFVFRECCRLGIPWQGVVHDLSKFRPDEWFPYAEYFYGGPHRPRQDYPGEMRFVFERWTKEAVEAGFDKAWLLHQHRNPHHWQYWVLREDDGGTKALPMPDRFRREMLADWIGAGLAMGKPDTAAWYEASKERMILHPDTRAWIERELAATRAVEVSR